MRLLPLALIIVLVTAACRTPVGLVPPTPDAACPDTVNWHGLVPGRSTRDDVIKALGQPSQTGSRQYAEGSIPFFAYPIEPGGIVARFSQDRVFFWGNGIVAWIEVTVADRDGKFHPAGEVISRLGKTIDVAYENSTYNPAVWQYDVLSGPDQLYVWSNCGMALDVFMTCSATSSGALACSSSNFRGPTPTPQIASDLTFRHSNRYPGRPMALYQVTAENAMLMEFLFPPTTYAGFVDNYMYKIPYGLWNRYLHEIQKK